MQSQWLARCHVTIQRCSAAPAPKLSGTEKLLLCHRLTLSRSFFPDLQTVIIIIIIIVNDAQIIVTLS